MISRRRSRRSPCLPYLAIKQGLLSRVDVHSLDPLEGPSLDTSCRQSSARVGFPHAGLARGRSTSPTVTNRLSTRPHRQASASTNGVVVCGVRSWLTGPRLVSVPFSRPLRSSPVTDRRSSRRSFRRFKSWSKSATWKYVEIRPRTTVAPLPTAFRECHSYHLHRSIFAPSQTRSTAASTRIPINAKYAEQSARVYGYVEGRSETFLREFYDCTC